MNSEKNFSSMPEGIRSSIFTNSKDAVEYCDFHGLFDIIKTCEKCKSSMRLEYDESYVSKHRLRCMNIECRASKPILRGLKISKPNIPLHEYLFILYSWLEKSYEYNLLKNSDVSLNSIKRIKRLLIKVVTEDNNKEKKKIGLFNPIQVDESIIIKGRLKTNPTDKYDKVKGTWIVGAIEEKSRELILEIVPDRIKETFLDFFNKNVVKGSVVKTDGHASYPFAVDGIRGKHKVVNHAKGFKSAEGVHTNLIEGEWSLFKSDIKKRKGVPGFAMKGYVQEYLWRRRNLPDHLKETYKSAFLNLLKLLFKK